MVNVYRSAVGEGEWLDHLVKPGAGSARETARERLEDMNIVKPHSALTVPAHVRRRWLIVGQSAHDVPRA